MSLVRCNQEEATSPSRPPTMVPPPGPPPGLSLRPIDSFVGFAPTSSDKPATLLTPPWRDQRARAAKLSPASGAMKVGSASRRMNLVRGPPRAETLRSAQHGTKRDAWCYRESTSATPRARVAGDKTNVAMNGREQLPARMTRPPIVPPPPPPPPRTKSGCDGPTHSGGSSGSGHGPIDTPTVDMRPILERRYKRQRKKAVHARGHADAYAARRYSRW